MPKLVICEKRNSASRISFILSNGDAKREFIKRIPVWSFKRDGEDYFVIGLRGHIVGLDYPEEYNQWDKVDLRQLAVADPEKKVLAPSIVSTAEKVLKKADEIIVATDYDREGELIGVEFLDVLGESVARIPKKRARFSALTKYEIERAFDNLTEIDYRLAESAESRQMIDLAWGASLTRFMSLATNKLGKDFLSVGRVQSPTLALIVDRERKIEEFIPQSYWEVIAEFEKGIVFQAIHSHGRFWQEKEAKRVFNIAQSAEFGTVTDYYRKEERKRPPAPFDTTGFLAEANKLGYSASRAMRVAEALYTGGLISYPRTDNTVYPKTLSLRRILEKLKDSDLSKEVEEILKLERLKPTRGKKFSTDHPPIHPVAGGRKEKLKKDEWRIYELISRRFLATLAPDMILFLSEATLDVNGEKFKASGTLISEKGWLRYYPYHRIQETELPELLLEENVPLREVSMIEGKTKPPPRYSQGALIREMERLGLGTKSTRHEIIQKLIRRKYVHGRHLKPTDSGIALINALEEHARQITKPEMTRTLENDMLDITKGDKQLEDVVRESQEMLLDTLRALQAHEKDIGQEITEALKKQNRIGQCKECGGDLLIVRSRAGKRFIGCSNYPECKVTHPLPQTGMVLPTDEVCDVCGSPKVRLVSGGRSEVICVDSECVTTRQRILVGECKECGGDLLIRHSAQGKRFLGCSNYPKCTETHSLPQRGLILPTELQCKTCSSPMIRVIKKNRKPWLLCINWDCPSKKK